MDNALNFYKGNTPATFLEWLEAQEKISSNFNINLRNYQLYIKTWAKQTNISQNDVKDVFTRLYVDFLKEITLNFTTEEEKRFIVNFDFTKKNNLDIILPFFIEKIKNICLYYADKREKLKEKVALTPYSGTTFFIKKSIKNLILDNIESGIIVKESEGRVNFPALTAINRNLDVKVEELYDISEYFDKKESNINIDFDIKNEIDEDLYLDFTQAIYKVIREYPLYIDSIFGSSSFNYNLTGDSVELVNSRDFINYINTLSSEDIKINLKKQLSKYVSSDFYYLSVGSTTTDFTSGVLFKSGPNVNKDTNFSNRDYPTVAYVPNLNNLYSSYYLGGFFVPEKTGVLQYNSFVKTFIINKQKLEPNSVYVFPDPAVVQSQDTSIPLTYKVDLSWGKDDIDKGLKFGNVLSDSHFHRFYGYQSYSQDINSQPFGLSLSEDNIDFWSGDEDSQWTEKDLWPGLDTVEKLPIQARLETLLIDKGEMEEWYVDVFGNEYGLYKQTQTNSIYDKKRNESGSLFIKNTVTNLVSSFSSFFNKLLFKFPEHVKQELQSDIYSFYTIQNIILLETKNFVCVVPYTFDFSTGDFIATVLPGIYIPKYEINPDLEKFINYYYVESKQKLYLCFTKLLPNLSGSNYKYIYPVIYEMDIDTLEFDQKYPGLELNTTLYTLSSKNFKNYPEVDLKYIESGKFTYKEKFSIFNLSYYGFNLNNIPFIVNEQFSLNEGTGELVSYIPLLNKPYFYSHDVNFSNPEPDPTLRFFTNYTENVGNKDLSNFIWIEESKKNDNFIAVNRINPAFINYPGSYYVHFNFEQYIFGSVFIGCEGIRTTSIDNINFIEFNDGTPIVPLEEEDKWYKVKDYIFNNTVFTLSARRPFNTNSSVLHFYIDTASETTSLSAPFCNNLFSVYKTVSIVKRGTGEGIVTSDPYCIDCGELCEFYYPINGSLTLTPSAGPNTIFSGWVGAPCEGSAGNCLLTVTDNTTVTAVFNSIPTYTLNVATNLPGTFVSTLDGKITCGETCSAVYFEGEIAALSASPPPLGFRFDGFLGRNSPCAGNNPCGVVMTRNYSLTATYLSSVNSINLYNNFRRNVDKGTLWTFDNNENVINDFNVDFTSSRCEVEWGDGTETTIYTNTNVNKTYTQQSNLRGIGTIYCSLSPDLPITKEFEFFAPRGTFVTVSAVTDEPYTFVKYEGNPCNNSSQTCNFIVTDNLSITGFFDYPLYTVSVLNSGEGLVYVESADGKLNCGTRSLINTRNTCTTTYISGDIVTISAVSVGSSVVTLLSSNNNQGVLSPFFPGGVEKLTYDFLITQNSVITAFNAGLQIFSLTIIKTGTDNAAQGVVLFDNFEEQEIIPAGTKQKTFILNGFSTGIIKNINAPLNTYHAYTIGFSGLNYIYTPGNLITITPSPSTVLNEKDAFFNNSSPLLSLSGDGAPYFIPFNNTEFGINIDNTDAYITMYNNATAFVFYLPSNYLAVEETANIGIYTQDFKYINIDK